MQCPKIHGGVASLSPKKASVSGRVNYFEDQISDGKMSMQLVGFDTKLQQKLAESQEKKEAVAISNCEVKANRWGLHLEVMVEKKTQLERSTSSCDVSKHCASNKITLDQLQHL